MIFRILNALFVGFLLISTLDFLLFLGMKINYFDYYHINEYFNIYYFDNQPVWLILPISLIFGYLLFYTPYRKFIQILYLILLLIFILPLFEIFGKEIGEKLFMKKNTNFTFEKTNFTGDLLYRGRHFTYFYFDDLNKTIAIKNEDKN